MSVAELTIDLRCVKCGTLGVGTCRCWIKLECPRCGDWRWAERDHLDPPTAVRIVFPCSKDNEPDELIYPRYYSASGAEIPMSEWPEPEGSMP